MRIPYDAPVPLSHTFVELTEDIVAAILITVEEGWQQALKFGDVHSQAGEVAMTERLRDGMRLTLKAKDHPWGKELIILPGTESRSSPSVLLPDGRTDIPIVNLNVFLRTQEHDPHAILECKRVVGADAHLCREYVLEGMDRFRTGKYAANHGVGFMVGYVIAGNLEEAVNGINSYLIRSARSGDALAPEPVGVSSQTWGSDHARAVPLAPIHLCHMFLDAARMAA
jgi:hypothetical protein